jgi:Flp pilus assembly protein TadD
VRRRQLWIDATCSAHVDILDPDSLRTVSTFDTHGEGTSPRVTELTDEERNTAIDQAARYAAVAAAEEITPRRVRETIALDETAPLFEKGMSMIDSDRLAEARSIWEQALVRRKDSAPLHFNLAAVYEALGDIVAAQQHYREARRLAPNESRYRIELELFRRRNRLKQ